MSIQDNYKVLARRTRPLRFSELIGQESLSNTIKSALSSGRIAHSFIFTGTRGVGKTTTARLIALALNCVGTDGKGDITSEPCGVCDQCKAIQEDRHVDVIEVDAATRTGVDDVRQLMEGMTYKPVMGRFKVYIIDEVHMLSKSAFNALLKTLEEPPAHVKFIFATTEIRKVPLTILSRCQRYDLKRVSVEALSNHFARILDEEKVSFDDDAVEKIAHLANGSVRDGLSLLEQVIQGKEKLTLKHIKNALGLLDKKDVETLYLHIASGNAKQALELASKLYESHADPIQIIEDLLSVSHQLSTLITLDQKPPKDSMFYKNFESLSLDAILLIWTVLLKGIEEIKMTSLAFETLEIILIRAIYIQGFRGENAKAPMKNESTLDSKAAFQNKYTVQSFEEVVSLFKKKKELILANYLTHDVGLIRFAPGYIELSAPKKDSHDLRGQISSLLKEYTQTPWDVVFSSQSGALSIADQKEQEDKEKKEKALESDAAQAATKLFPGAKITVK